MNNEVTISSGQNAAGPNANARVSACAENPKGNKWIDKKERSQPVSRAERKMAVGVGGGALECQERRTGSEMHG